MTQRNDIAATALRLSDLVPLRQMLGRSSFVIRVNPDGSFVPYQRMPALFFDRPIRSALGSDASERFARACASAILAKRATVFTPDPDLDDELLINPILDRTNDNVRFLVCWTRDAEAAARQSKRGWEDLRLDEVVTRYRLRTEDHAVTVEVSPWWALEDGEVIELWPHHKNVSAMGLGHAVMEMLIMNAAEAAAEVVGGPAVRIVIPSADMLAGLVPVFHGALRGSGLAPDQLMVAIDVELATDPDLLPIIVHLRTLGIQIDIVGLDALTATLHTVSDTSNYTHLISSVGQVTFGPWVTALVDALAEAA